MTLERFNTICMNGFATNQGNHTRIWLSLIITLTLVVIFTVPKGMEYTANTSDIRTNYDLQDKQWRNVVSKIRDKDLQKDDLPYNLDVKGHLFFLQNYRDIAETGVSSYCKKDKFMLKFNIE